MVRDSDSGARGRGFDPRSSSGSPCCVLELIKFTPQKYTYIVPRFEQKFNTRFFRRNLLCLNVLSDSNSVIYEMRKVIKYMHLVKKRG